MRRREARLLHFFVRTQAMVMGAGNMRFCRAKIYSRYQRYFIARALMFSGANKKNVLADSFKRIQFKYSFLLRARMF